MSLTTKFIWLFIAFAAFSLAACQTAPYGGSGFGTKGGQSVPHCYRGMSPGAGCVEGG